MAEVTRDVDAPVSQVWDVIADGWSYAGWVVGASHIRKVDAGWPALGTRIHHSVGAWPVTIDDTTEVVRVDQGRMIELTARAWPTGEALVRLELEPQGPARTRMRMVEQARSGPARLLPKPVQDALLKPRNVEALSRLSDLVLRRSGD
ncbi:SRPBCC family protein [Actinokineospora sp. PR83]|uniref:SRPBCC family protein n=1 Tax=Actinokineospora sp. PR83 TaxID=2884908 RepID=UPI001F3C90F8|nr:SRPBCC family protein [Actinokineospora sp. PR83]MCG8916543.1 SRPBCC family protein [Actinokineospora sp. PR83]